MAKRVRLSLDDVTYVTLPGNTGELNSEAGQLDDTIFGQSYQSNQPGLIADTVSANGIFKGFAGYQAKILKGGTTTSMTTEAMSLVSGKTYQITAGAKRVMDRAVTVNVFDNAVNHNADVESIDWLFGRVTFDSGYTVTGPVTITGSYFPMAVVGCANEYTLTQTANAVDNTCMDIAQANEGHRTYETGLKTVQLELNGIYKAANGFQALLEDRAELMIEINPDGNQKTMARGFFRAVSTGQSGDVGDLEAENITFSLSVPDQETPAPMPYAFHWLIASDSTLNEAVEYALTAWETDAVIYYHYLPDGTNGWAGEGVITDITLSGGLESMNEFTVEIQSSGAKVAQP